MEGDGGEDYPRRGGAAPDRPGHAVLPHGVNKLWAYRPCRAMCIYFYLLHTLVYALIVLRVLKYLLSGLVLTSFKKGNSVALERIGRARGRAKSGKGGFGGFFPSL